MVLLLEEAQARLVNLTLVAKCVNATGERVPETVRERGYTSVQAKADESTTWQAVKTAQNDFQRGRFGVPFSLGLPDVLCCGSQ